MFYCDNNKYINVEFVGYTEEYNVIDECMRIMKERECI